MSLQTAIIILNYISFEDTFVLVEELQKQTIKEKIKILVVDNDSPNESYKELKKLEQKFKNVVVIKTDTNKGYAQGNNHGLHYLEKYVNPEYVAILNNDIILKPDTFELLMFKYKILAEPAVIAPLQLDSGQNVVPVYNLNTFLDDCLHLFYCFKLFHKRKVKPFRDSTGLKAMDVDLVPGSFMFSSFNRFKEMGFFYPNTFLFVE